MAIVEVNVTQADIDAGCEVEAFNCPVSIAVTRLLRIGLVAGVCSSFIAIYPRKKMECEGSELIRRDTPDEVSMFVGAFDGGEPVSPITFQLDIPTEMLSPNAYASL